MSVGPSQLGDLTVNLSGERVLIKTGGIFNDFEAGELYLRVVGPRRCRQNIVATMNGVFSSSSSDPVTFLPEGVVLGFGKKWF